MNKVSRPMQVALGAAIVFALVWFAVLRPQDPAEPVAATPVTPAETTPAATPAKSAIGKTIESAEKGAASADAEVKRRESATGETTPPAAATTPATPNASTPSATTPATPSGTATKADDAAKSGVSAGQARANKVTEKIGKDLAKGRAVVVLVWSKNGKEDKIVHRRVSKEINRRKGEVRVYKISVDDVGRYDGLLGGLGIGQIPSTVVIAPDNQAKVLGGLVATERIDRLTSAASLTKPLDSGAKK